MALNDRSKIVDSTSKTEMKTSYINYSMSVIVSRALPDVRDGLKPSQRRILVAMNDLNLAPGRGYRKCAKIAGDTSGNYHPHGESVVYPTLVRMAQPFAMRYPLVDGQGNFGSIDGDAPAAMRYTEARLTRARGRDARRPREEHRRLPAELRRDARGAGRCCRPCPEPAVQRRDGHRRRHGDQLPPHNLCEICDAIIAVLDDPRSTRRRAAQDRQGPGLPDRRHHLGHAGDPGLLPQRARPDAGARASVQVEEGARRPQSLVHRDPVPGQQGGAAREDRRPRAAAGRSPASPTCATSPTATACAS